MLIQLNPIQRWHLLSRNLHQDYLSDGSNDQTKLIWLCNTTSFASKFKLYKSLVTSILLYSCETWTLLADVEKRIQSSKTKGMNKLFHISYLEHKTNDRMRSKINFLLSPQKPLLATVKRWKLAWFRHVTCHNSLSILQDTVEGGRCHGGQRKC